VLQTFYRKLANETSKKTASKLQCTQESASINEATILNSVDKLYFVPKITHRTCGLSNLVQISEPSYYNQKIFSTAVLNLTQTLTPQKLRVKFGKYAEHPCQITR